MKINTFRNFSFLLCKIQTQNSKLIYALQSGHFIELDKIKFT